MKERFDLTINDKKYVLTKLLDKGDKSTVYVAKTDDSPVAIKLVAHHSDSRRAQRQQMQITCEIDILRMVDHPNIIKIIDYVKLSSCTYIVYPYTSSCISLEKLDHSWYNMKCKFNFITFINLQCQVANALQYLHLNSIVHRDIKPENILVTVHKSKSKIMISKKSKTQTYIKPQNQKPYACLIDFDLACVIGNDAYKPSSGYTGTVDFMAPEIWEEVETIDLYKTDIYSFGVTMFSMMNNGELPYEEFELSDIRDAINNGLGKKSVSPSESINKLINEMMSKDPVLRPGLDEILNVLHKELEL